MELAQLQAGVVCEPVPVAVGGHDVLLRQPSFAEVTKLQKELEALEDDEGTEEHGKAVMALMLEIGLTDKSGARLSRDQASQMAMNSSMTWLMELQEAISKQINPDVEGEKKS